MDEYEKRKGKTKILNHITIPKNDTDKTDREIEIEERRD